MNKAFDNISHNKIHLTFPNGNSISTIWGVGSYTENHDFILTDGTDFTEKYHTFLGSDTVEIMILKAPNKLLKKLKKKYGLEEDSVVGHITITQWLEILNMLNK